MKIFKQCSDDKYFLAYHKTFFKRKCVLWLFSAFLSLKKNGIKKKYLTNEQKNVMESFHILWLDKMIMAVLFLQQTQTKGEIMNNIFTEMLLGLIKKHNIQPVDFDEQDMTLIDLGRLSIYTHETPVITLTNDALLYGIASDIITIAHNYKMDLEHTKINLVVDKMIEVETDRLKLGDVGYETELQTQSEEYGDWREIYKKSWIVYSVSYAHEEADVPSSINIKLRTR